MCDGAVTGREGPGSRNPSRTARLDAESRLSAQLGTGKCCGIVVDDGVPGDVLGDVGCWGPAAFSPVGEWLTCKLPSADKRPLRRQRPRRIFGRIGI